MSRRAQRTARMQALRGARRAVREVEDTTGAGSSSTRVPIAQPRRNSDRAASRPGKELLATLAWLVHFASGGRSCCAAKRGSCARAKRDRPQLLLERLFGFARERLAPSSEAVLPALLSCWDTPTASQCRSRPPNWLARDALLFSSGPRPFRRSSSQRGRRLSLGLLNHASIIDGVALTRHRCRVRPLRAGSSRRHSRAARTVPTLLVSRSYFSMDGIARRSPPPRAHATHDSFLVVTKLRLGVLGAGSGRRARGRATRCAHRHARQSVRPSRGLRMRLGNAATLPVEPRPFVRVLDCASAGAGGCSIGAPAARRCRRRPPRAPVRDRIQAAGDPCRGRSPFVGHDPSSWIIGDAARPPAPSVPRRVGRPRTGHPPTRCRRDFAERDGGALTETELSASARLGGAAGRFGRRA